MGSVCTSICAFFSMFHLFGVVVFHRSMVNWRSGVGSVCTGVVVSIDLWLIGGGGWGLSALVSVHSAICEI